MQDQNNSAIFNLEVDEVAKSHLLDGARWAKFLAIVGFIFLGLFVLLALFTSMVISNVNSSLLGGMSGIGIFLFYLIIAAINFYPCLALYRFASKIKPALQTMNREQFNASLANLKSLFQYLGILTIISLGLVGLSLIVSIVIGLM